MAPKRPQDSSHTKGILPWGLSLGLVEASWGLWCLARPSPLKNCWGPPPSLLGCFSSSFWGSAGPLWPFGPPRGPEEIPYHMSVIS